MAGKVMDVDHGVLDTRIGQPVEHMVQHGSPADPHQRLRQRVGDRAHALAEPGRKHHGPADRRRSGFGHANLSLFVDRS